MWTAVRSARIWSSRQPTCSRLAVRISSGYAVPLAVEVLADAAGEADVVGQQAAVGAGALDPRVDVVDHPAAVALVAGQEVGVRDQAGHAQVRGHVAAAVEALLDGLADERLRGYAPESVPWFEEELFQVSLAALDRLGDPIRPRVVATLRGLFEAGRLGTADRRWEVLHALLEAVFDPIPLWPEQIERLAAAPLTADQRAVLRLVVESDEVWAWERWVEPPSREATPWRPVAPATRDALRRLLADARP
jgi:hypothetical protein